MRKYRDYNDKDVERVAAEVTSMADLLSNLGLRVAGGNYANMKRLLQKLDVDCSHWTGQAWSKNERLKDWSEYTKANSLKPHLIAERGHQCEQCKFTTWQGAPITLEVEHCNGDKTDNSPKNLKLLCCNCHALTRTWRGRKNAKIAE